MSQRLESPEHREHRLEVKRRYQYRYRQLHPEQARENDRRYRELHREQANESNRQWYQRNKERERERKRLHPTNRDCIDGHAYRLKRKMLVLQYYGERCACCGENHIQFLTIDHVNGGGNKHRRENNITGGSTMYTWLIRHNFPEGFRTLCFNCNCARGCFGHCPHEVIVKS